MAELSIGILIFGVLTIADPERLQQIIDRLRELATWLAE